MIEQGRMAKVLNGLGEMVVTTDADGNLIVVDDSNLLPTQQTYNPWDTYNTGEASGSPTVPGATGVAQPDGSMIYTFWGADATASPQEASGSSTIAPPGSTQETKQTQAISDAVSAGLKQTAALIGAAGQLYRMVQNTNGAWVPQVYGQQPGYAAGSFFSSKIFGIPTMLWLAGAGFLMMRG